MQLTICDRKKINNPVALLTKKMANRTLFRGFPLIRRVDFSRAQRAAKDQLTGKQVDTGGSRQETFFKMKTVIRNPEEWLIIG